MTGPAHTNTTTAVEVLRRQILGAVAGKCISGASAEAATDAVMDVIAGLLADPGTRTAPEPTNWHATHWHLTDGRCVSPYDEVTDDDRTVTDWTPVEENEHG